MFRHKCIEMHFSHLVRKQQRSSLPACPGLALHPALALHVMLARPSLPVCPVPACQCGQARFRAGPGQTGCQGQGSLPVTASPLIDRRGLLHYECPGSSKVAKKLNFLLPQNHICTRAWPDWQAGTGQRGILCQGNRAGMA
ncbi:hypothetical protein M5K25_009013 [Dendrobium thyrsiflorum]|uniref:Uncharacterized protein n=1 Tax=Dendrobium thyrsiflorum TaxID=117978 RepID=A0ABD0V4R0_DENTH